MLKKLKHRFILITMLIVTFIMLMCLLAIYMVSFRMARNQIIVELNNISAEIIGDDTLLIDKREEEDNHIFDPPSSTFASVTVVLDKSGSIESAYSNGSIISNDDKAVFAASYISESEETSGILFEHYLIFCETAANDGRTVISFTSLNTLINRVAIVINASAIAIASCVGLFFVIIYILAGVVMRPVERAWEREKQFVADVSHDLKTPLTVIMTNTEIIRKLEGERSPETVKWLDSTKDEAERMKRLVEGMLELAKSECINETIVLSNINISEICERIVLTMEPIAFEKNVFISTAIVKNTVIKSNSDYFARLMQILVDNAIKYAKEESRVIVKLKRKKREVKISVFNEGSYISEEEIPHLFERFWKSDQSRASESFGLGLSIAKNLCENLGGRISVSSDKASGTEFSMIFPR